MSRMVRVLTVSGPRPEASRLAPVIRELRRHPGGDDHPGRALYCPHLSWTDRYRVQD